MAHFKIEMDSLQELARDAVADATFNGDTAEVPVSVIDRLCRLAGLGGIEAVLSAG